MKHGKIYITERPVLRKKRVGEPEKSFRKEGYRSIWRKFDEKGRISGQNRGLLEGGRYGGQIFRGR